MDLFNKLFHWKKNIKRVPLTGYTFGFDPNKTNIDAIKCEVTNLAERLKIDKLSNVFENNLLYKSVDKKSFYFPNEFNFAKNTLLGQYFSLSLNQIYDRQNTFIVITLNINFDSDQIIDKSEFLKLTGLYYAYSYNPHYSAWENMNSPQFYKYRRCLKIYFSDMFKVKMVDLTDRPGRRQWKNDFFFQGSSEYWFGNSFFNLISKESLLQFHSCDLIEELENGFVHVKLFDLLDYWEDENQARLANFRKFLKIDE